MVGLQLRCARTPCGQSGSLRGLKLVPAKRRYLVPPTSIPTGITHTVGRFFLKDKLFYVHKMICSWFANKTERRFQWVS
jgi:hypothetical protein